MGDIFINNLPQLDLHGYDRESARVAINDFIKDSIRKNYLKNNVKLDLDEVFVCDGAKSDLGNMVEILGDNRIIIPDPVI